MVERRHQFKLFLVRRPVTEDGLRHAVVAFHPRRALPFEVLERVEGHAVVEFLLVRPMAPLDLPIMLRGPGLYPLAGDLEPRALDLERVGALIAVGPRRVADLLGAPIGVLEQLQGPFPGLRVLGQVRERPPL